MYASFVADVAGNHPSADGTLNFFFYQADANFDRTVNALDFNALATNFGGANKTYSQGNYNYDANVDTLDFGILAMKFNSTLPNPAPPLGSLVNQASSVPSGSLFNGAAKIDSVGAEILG